MAKVKRTNVSVKKIESPFKNYWDKSNIIIFAVGIVVLILGFILMNQYPWDNPLSLSVSPWVLLVAYLIIFPLSIFYRRKKKDQ